MQPAYYEDFVEIQNKYWSMLDDAVTNRGSPFRIPVFICAHQDEVDGRIVVLRKSDRASNLLQFHTDLRSPKVDILKKNKNASLVFYDKEEKIQLRVKVECEVNNQNSTTEESWKKTQHISRRCYLTDSPPGTTSENPTSGMISKLDETQVWVYINDLPPSQMIEYGAVLPESGKEKEWFASLPGKLKKKLSAIES